MGEVRPWNGRGHFFAAAAEAMRRILVEAARRKGSRRRGGERRRCELLDGDLVTCPVSDELLDLDEALSKLSSADAQAAEVVDGERPVAGVGEPVRPEAGQVNFAVARDEPRRPD